MKKIYYCILLGFFTSTAFAQVGIGTNSPKATLDLAYTSIATTPDGILIPRVTGNDLKAKDALYTSGQNSTIVFVTAKPTTTSTKTASIDTSGFYIYDAPNAKWIKWYDYTSTLKSFVKGGATTSSIGILNISLSGASYNLIKFNKTDFDENNEFDTASKTFTAKQDGIYRIYVQMETSSVVAANDVGVAIFKQVGSANPVILSEENYNSINISISLVGLNINVSPPTRQTQTLVKLNKGDKIFFAASSSLLGVQLLGSSNSFFTIEQVK